MRHKVIFLYYFSFHAADADISGAAAADDNGLARRRRRRRWLDDQTPLSTF